VVTAHRWSRADSATSVWLYEIEGGRHDWPGASGNQDIAAEEEIWSFFERYVEGTTEG
jgi:polyhydroxybutyrate depolymerase